MRRISAFLLMLGCVTMLQVAHANGPTLTAHIDTRHGPLELTLEYVITPEARERGLMYRTDLGASDGMLFVFPRPGPIAFWMKHTLIPLDMLFLDAHGKILRIAAHTQPEDVTPIPGGAAIQSVIELAAGRAEALRLRVGDHVTYHLPKDAHVE